MEKLFYIETKNRHNQVLIFDDFNEAYTWCKQATSWSDEKIKGEIKTTHKTFNGYFNYFPSDKVEVK